MKLDFILKETVDDNLLSTYRNILPENLIYIWENYGFGCFANGFIKVVNPNDYADLLKELYQSPINKNPTVMFITGMGDIIVWENDFTVFLNLKKGKTKVIESGFQYFIDDVSDVSFLEEELDNKNFINGSIKLGDLAYDECYGYFPLIGMGGFEKIENLKKIKIKEYISISAQTLGKIR